MPAGTTGHVAVSVVVPVYNPGTSIEACIVSLLGQSLAADQLELIFVDDGSTDGTADRLDRLAAEHANVRVIHEPNSGWAGRPRNMGVEAAIGKYVQFVDQDDTLGPEALERLTRYADDNDADIVIGKVTSDFRAVPHDVWAVNIPRCSVRTAPVIESLTPHKMFRRSFLITHDLRFPEGPRRLEDQHFMTAAYFATDRVAILGDYPCYFYCARPDGDNAGGATIEPVGYYGNLREVLDIVEANTEPGTFRDEQLRRFLVALLRRVDKVATNDGLPDDFKASVFREARAVTLERFPESVRDGLPAVQRARAAALVADRLDEIIEIGRWTAGIRVVANQGIAEPIDSGWRLHISARLTHADGEPVLVDQSSDTADEITSHAAAIVSVRERDTAVDWPAPGRLTSRLEPVDTGKSAYQLVYEGHVDIDPATVAGGVRLEPGIWRVMLRIRALGISRTSQLRLDGVEELPSVVLRPRPTVARLRHAGDSTRLVVAVKRKNEQVAKA